MSSGTGQGVWESVVAAAQNVAHQQKLTHSMNDRLITIEKGGYCILVTDFF